MDSSRSDEKRPAAPAEPALEGRVDETHAVSPAQSRTQFRRRRGAETIAAKLSRGFMPRWDPLV